MDCTLFYSECFCHLVGFLSTLEKQRSENLYLDLKTWAKEKFHLKIKESYSKINCTRARQMGMALLGNLGIRGAACCCCCRREDITGFYFSKILVLNDNFQLLLKKRVLQTFAFIYCLIVVGSKWGAGLENRCLERVGNLDGGSAQVLSHDSGMAQGRHWPQQKQTTIIIYCLKSSMFSAPMRSKTMGHDHVCLRGTAFSCHGVPGPSPPGGASGVPWLTAILGQTGGGCGTAHIPLVMELALPSPPPLTLTSVVLSQ